MSDDKTLKDRAIEFEGKDYVLVKDRVIYFVENYPNGGIETMILSQIESDSIVVKALVTPDWELPSRRFTGHAQEKVGDGDINKTSALENAETSAVGRALAMMGIGVIDSIASIDEINKAKNRSKSEKKAETPVHVNKNETAEVESIIEVINGIEKVEDLKEIKKQIKESGLSRESIKILAANWNAKNKELKNA